MTKPEQKPEKTVNRLHAELRAQQRILTILAAFPRKAQLRIYNGIACILSDTTPGELSEGMPTDKEF